MKPNYNCIDIKGMLKLILLMGLDKNVLIESLKGINFELNDAQFDLLDKFEKLVIETNEKFNLTNIATEPDFTIKHIVDSLMAIPLIPNGASVLDIGAGAGFPSVPLAICREDIAITAIDSTEKKINFILKAASDLEIKNIKAKSVRAEEYKVNDKYDCVVARAVASLQVLLELALPLLKVGGTFIAYKATDEEVKDCTNALNVLGGKITRIEKLNLPNGDARCFIVVEKQKETPPKYPRIYSLIKKKPL